MRLLSAILVCTLLACSAGAQDRYRVLTSGDAFGLPTNYYTATEADAAIAAAQPASLVTSLNTATGGVNLVAGANMTVQRSGTNITLTSTATVEGTLEYSAVAAYLTAPSTTTCATADTWYTLEGTFDNNLLDDFTFEGDHIKYVGESTKDFLLGYSGSFKSSDAGGVFHVGVSNSAVLSQFTMGQNAKTAGVEYNISAGGTVSLSSNDTIKLVVMADDNGVDLTAVNFTTYLHSLGTDGSGYRAGTNLTMRTTDGTNYFDVALYANGDVLPAVDGGAITGMVLRTWNELGNPGANWGLNYNDGAEIIVRPTVNVTNVYDASAITTAQTYTVKFRYYVGTNSFAAGAATWQTSAPTATNTYFEGVADVTAQGVSLFLLGEGSE